MSLSRRVGYLLPNFNKWNRTLKENLAYIDYLELLIKSNYFRSGVSTYYTENIQEIINYLVKEEKNFNIKLDSPLEAYNQTTDKRTEEKNRQKGFKTLSTNLKRLNLTSYSNLLNIILPIPLDPTEKDELDYKENLVFFLKNLKKESDVLLQKIVLDIQIKSEIKNLNQIEVLIRDIEKLVHYSISNEKKRVDISINIPSWYHFLKQKGIVELFRGLKRSEILPQFFYLADYSTGEVLMNGEFLDLGKGQIDWKFFLSYFREANLTFITKGTIISLKRSLAYLGDILIKRRRNIQNTHTISGFYFSKSKISFFQTSPGAKLAIKYLNDTNMSIESVIDLGCGNGRNSYYFSRRFHSEILLVDLDRDLLDYVTTLFEIHNTNPPEGEVVDLENTENADVGPYYDVTFLSYVIQNINPTKFLEVMDFCRRITEKIIVFEIYINDKIYPEGVVTQRGDKCWYGFSQQEVFELFETFFEVISWATKKGKTNPLMISIVGVPRKSIGNLHKLYQKYNNIGTIDYKKLKPVIKKTSHRPNSSRKKKNKKILLEQGSNNVQSNLIEIFYPYLTSTGITNDQLSVLKKELEKIKLNFLSPNELGATIVFIARKLDIPIHIQEIAKTLDISRKMLFQGVRNVKNKYSKVLLPTRIELFFDRYHNYLKIGDCDQRSSKEILKQFKSEFDLKTISSLSHINALTVALLTLENSGKKVNSHKIAKNLHMSPSLVKKKMKLLT